MSSIEINYAVIKMLTGWNNVHDAVSIRKLFIII